MLTRLIRGISFLAVTAVALFQYATWHHLSPISVRGSVNDLSYVELMQGLFDSIGTGTRIAIFVAAQWEWGHGLTAGLAVLSLLLLVAALQLSPILGSRATSSPGS